ncbi:MAG TPA: M64 family metallopeptidase [Pyrinomonadaceae bacterium]|nr:M64 family metallopeptidase [Pyrinomonadaceae bacterium]
MAIMKLDWLGTHNQDIHILSGQASNNILDNLRVTEPDGTTHTAVDYQEENDIPLTCTALFKGEPDALGIHVVTARTGDVVTSLTVRADALLPPLSKHNFLIELSMEENGETFSTVIRIHIHKEVRDVWLTPNPLTAHPGKTLTPGDTDPTVYRFTVRAKFDDDVIGDLTQHYNVTWTDEQGGTDHVNAQGFLIITETDNPGTTHTITATLPASLGGGTASATMRVAADWEDTVLRKAEIIPGGGWPGTIRPEVVPNILFLGDGFAAGDRPAFERITTEMVHFLKKNRLARPFDLLCTSMNFWRAFVPATKRGISVLCEVYTYPENGKLFALPVLPPVEPPDSGKWNLANLIYAMGLPVARNGAAHVAPDDLRAEWKVLVDVPPAIIDDTNIISDDLIADWQSLATRTFIEEVDNYPGLSMGDPPAADQKTRTPMLEIHGRRGRRGGLDRFFSNLEGQNIPFITEKLEANDPQQPRQLPLGALWAEQLGFPFDNTGLIILVSSLPGGRAQNSGTHITVSTQNGWLKIPVKEVGGKLELDYPSVEVKTDPDIARTIAHELGHSFGLGDEYVEVESAFKGTRADLEGHANLEGKKEVTEVQAGNLVFVPKKIYWNWHRVRKAAVIEGTIESAGGNRIRVPVQLGDGEQFGNNDPVLFRLRVPGEILAKALDITVSDREFKVVDREFLDPQKKDHVKALIIEPQSGAADIPALQIFEPGSLLFIPLRDSSLDPPYATMVASNIQQKISRDGPLYLRPTDPSKLTEQVRENKDTQVPNLRGVDLPICFKNKPRIIGLYEGGAQFGHDIYHPAGLCMMRTSHSRKTGFCAVCRYIMVDLINPFMHFQIDRDYKKSYPK